MRGLLNIKNNSNKSFLWFAIRYLNPLKIHPESITKADKSMVNDLGYKGTECPVSGKHFGKIEKKKNICINAFFYESGLVYPVYVSYVSDQKSKNCMDLLLIAEEFRSLYVYTKGFNRFMCNKTKSKIKIYFCRHCSQGFSSERVW